MTTSIYADVRIPGPDLLIPGMTWAWNRQRATALVVDGIFSPDGLLNSNPSWLASAGLWEQVPYVIVEEPW